jgi:hypothetical protein
VSSSQSPESDVVTFGSAVVGVSIIPIILDKQFIYYLFRIKKKGATDLIATPLFAL